MGDVGSGREAVYGSLCVVGYWLNEQAVFDEAECSALEGGGLPVSRSSYAWPLVGAILMMSDVADFADEHVLVRSLDLFREGFCNCLYDVTGAISL